MGGLEAVTPRRLRAVMLVDDDQPTLNCYDREIRLAFASRIRVLRASSGQAALAIASTDHVDLAIVDQHLGDVLGTDLLPKLRTLIPDLLTILTSAELSYDDARRAGDKTTAVLPKPRSWRPILTAIEAGENVNLLPLEKAELALASVERTHVTRVFRAQQDNVARAASVLGVDRSGLQRKLNKLGITRRPK